MTCSNCCLSANRFGKDRKGYQRFRCPKCRKTFTQPHNGTIHGMYVSTDKAEMIVRLFVEGTSVRSIERLTGMHRDTILRLLALVGERCERCERCERMLEDKIQKVPVRDVQCDEMWGFVGCKERVKTAEHPTTFGDAYCFVAIERKTKLVLAWHLGRRNVGPLSDHDRRIFCVSRSNQHVSWNARGLRATNQGLRFASGRGTPLLAARSR
jgi:transposase-like protein